MFELTWDVRSPPHTPAITLKHTPTQTPPETDGEELKSLAVWRAAPAAATVLQLACKWLWYVPKCVHPQVKKDFDPPPQVILFIVSALNTNLVKFPLSSDAKISHLLFWQSNNSEMNSAKVVKREGYLTKQGKSVLPIPRSVPLPLSAVHPYPLILITVWEFLLTQHLQGI